MTLARSTPPATAVAACSATGMNSARISSCNDCEMAENLAISAETASNSEGSNCSRMRAAFSGSNIKRKPASFCNWLNLENSVASWLGATSMTFIDLFVTFAPADRERPARESRLSLRRRTVTTISAKSIEHLAPILSGFFGSAAQSGSGVPPLKQWNEQRRDGSAPLGSGVMAWLGREKIPCFGAF